LRRRIKRARYGLANLSTLAPGAFEPWLLQLKQMQTALGDLQDLRVLVLTLERLLEERPDAVLPVLCSLICEARDQAWLRWHEASAQLRTAAGREALLALQSSAAAGWSGSRSLAISSTAPGLNPA
jgi:CHAD domain-containing protein